MVVLPSGRYGAHRSGRIGQDGAGSARKAHGVVLNTTSTQ